ncbi:flagellar filament capping protein FliD [bacterium]|nr:flagellar filament capping protein FliD [bacterium]
MAAGSIFQFAGLSSGFNTDTILQKMLDVQRAPIQALQTRQAQVTQEQTAWRSINTRLLALGTAAEKLQQSEPYQERRVTSSKADIVTASAQPGQDLGQISLSVEALAQSHQQISQGFATLDAPVGSGTVTLQVGSASFNPIQLEAPNATLQGLRDAINNSKHGIRASVLDAGESAGNSRYRLMLTSETSGSQGAIQATFNLDGTVPTMSTLVTAQDAHVKLGQGAAAVDVYSSTNSMSGALAGITLSLKSASPGTQVNLQLSRETSELRGNVQGLLDQYNTLAESFNANFKYNKDTGETGILFGDSTLLSLQQQLFDKVTGSREVGSSLNSLSAMGINVDDKGKLAITSNAAFEAALAKPDDVRKLFADTQFGIAAGVKNLVSQATNIVDGSVSLQDKRLTGHYDDIQQSITRTQQKVSRTEQRLRETFLAMESAMSKMKSQSQALSASLGSLPTSATGG